MTKDIAFAKNTFGELLQKLQQLIPESDFYQYSVRITQENGSWMCKIRFLPYYQGGVFIDNVQVI